MVGLEAVSGAGRTPVLEDDPKHPGYYKPFRCLSLDRTAQGGHKRGEIQNNCGFNVEVYWRDTTSGLNQWTIPAGERHPVFLEPTGDVLGCLPNGYLNPALKLCKRDGANPQAEADHLAKELGIVSSTTAPSRTDSQSDATRLAQQLGVSLAPARSEEYNAARLQRDIEKWEEQERLRRLEEERLRRLEEERQQRLREEQERVAALERARREQVLLEQQRALRERQEYEARVEKEGGCKGVLGFLGCAAEAIGAAAFHYEAQRAGIPVSRPGGSSGDSCRDDPALVARIQSILESCPIMNSACHTARSQVECYRQVEIAASSCPSVAQQAREMQRQYSEQAAAACL